MPALKPLPSVARIAANRANAEKSTGPTTDAGKARSRENALKHGMTGEGIALPTEDRARVEERFAALRAELGPTTTLGAHFAGKIALLTVRAERAAKQESAALAHRIRHAAEAFDRQRREAAHLLMARLDFDPANAHRDLVRMPEGVDALVDSLLDLRATLNLSRYGATWSGEHEAHYEACHGRRVGDRAVTRGLALSRALRGDDSLLGPADRPPGGPGPLASPAWATALIGEIDAEMGRLARHRATLDHDAIAEDRAGAADRALFDPGRDATLARRYEAASTRELFRTLDEFRAAEAAGPGPAPDAAPTPIVAPPAGPIEEVATVAVNPDSDHDLDAVLGSIGAGPVGTDRPLVSLGVRSVAGVDLAAGEVLGASWERAEGHPAAGGWGHAAALGA